MSLEVNNDVFIQPDLKKNKVLLIVAPDLGPTALVMRMGKQEALDAAKMIAEAAEKLP